LELSFSEKIRNEMNETKEFDSNLKQLASIDSSKIVKKEIQTMCMHIKNLIERLTWNLTDKAYKKSVSKITQLDVRHVLISFALSNRDACCEIKHKLEQLNIKCLMGINDSDLKSWSIQKMRDNVDKSACVVICLTENYRQCNECQLEANYALIKEKKIILLRMQEGCKVAESGWLNTLMKDHEKSAIEIDFLKPNFDECINQLSEELMKV
jgi:tRNA/tmRNA/rRNA uracil-C5-methylase (TrmA/RlmC/RlmD family)